MIRWIALRANEIDIWVETALLGRYEDPYDVFEKGDSDLLLIRGEEASEIARQIVKAIDEKKTTHKRYPFPKLTYTSR